MFSLIQIQIVMAKRNTDFFGVSSKKQKSSNPESYISLQNLPAETSNSNTSFTINQVEPVEGITDCPPSSSSSSFSTIEPVTLRILLYLSFFFFICVHVGTDIILELNIVAPRTSIVYSATIGNGYFLFKSKKEILKNELPFSSEIIS
ncbi:hypothetical protein QTP88_019736 [Uroleucon formosanum]